MKENAFKYIGYGFVGSKKSREEVDVTSSKAYKALRAAFLDSISIEVDDPETNTRKILKEIIKDLSKEDNDLSSEKDIVIVVPTVETLGSTSEEAASNYALIIFSFHIIILNRPDLSTCTLLGEEKVDLNDVDARMNLSHEFALTSITVRGRKCIPLNAKFKRVFWEWQNYYIDTQDAIDLLGCSKAILYSLSKEFMMNTNFMGLYSCEYCNLDDYTDKPIRGITLDNDTIEILIHIQRKIGFNWEFELVEQALLEIPLFDRKFITKDYIRLKLNYQYGRSAMIKATKTFSKGKEYVEKLKKDIENL